jgi:MFS family permease
MNAVRAVAALIVAMTILQLGQGLLAVFMPLAQRLDGLVGGEIGAIGAAYSAGFMLGAYSSPRMLSRVGHIRVFAACAAIGVAAMLSVQWADGVAAWVLARFVMGVAVAGMCAGVESWLNGALPKNERGNVIGIYMVCTKAALAVGPFLAGIGPPGAGDGLILAAAIMALAIVPVTFTAVSEPPPPKPEPISVRELIGIAPASVTAAFLAGVINAAALTFAPVYAASAFGPSYAAPFQASAMIGSLIIQWPAGRLSDRIDRRLVIAGLAGLAALAAAPLAFLEGEISFAVAAILFALFGAGALSYYGIAVAHMADRAAHGQIARAAAGLLFVWAGGSILGPMIVGVLADVFGLGAVFAFSGLGCAALAGLMLWRRQARAAPEPTTKEAFAPKQATSVAAAELAYGKGEEPKAP